MNESLPGASGEHKLQEKYGTDRRARHFYQSEMLDRLTPEMIAFIARQEMVFVATASAAGACDSSFRAGPAGFVHVLDERRVAYPEYRGNGVMASMGNITENPNIGLFFADFFDSTVGLHVNGRARIVENGEATQYNLPIPEPPAMPIAERWVLVEVEEAYIHCSKHIPLLAKLDKQIHWGSDNPLHKNAGYFHSKNTRGDAAQSKNPEGTTSQDHVT